MRNILKTSLAVAGLALLLTSCEQKDLCFNHWEHATKYDINATVDWQLEWEYQYPGGPDWLNNWDASKFGMTYNSLRPVIPEGLRAIVYNQEGGPSELNIPAKGGKLYMMAGLHSLLFFNNDFEYIQINNILSSAEATASTRVRTRVTYKGNSMVQSSRDETTVNPPDYLFGHYIEEYTAEATHEPQYLSFTMKPLVFTYLVRYHFKSGLEYVGLARGALSGMAESVYLTDGHTGTGQVTLLYDADITSWGVEKKVNSFGAPNFPNYEYSRGDQKYGLNLEVRLKNGKMLNFDFDVTDQMINQPRGGVIEVFDIVIPDDIGKEDSGTFDVEVEGWGDAVDVPIVF